MVSWDRSARCLSWLVSQRDAGLCRGQGMGSSWEHGAVHRHSYCKRGRAAREPGYFDRVLPAMRVNRRTLKSCSSASMGNC